MYPSPLYIYIYIEQIPDPALYIALGFPIQFGSVNDTGMEASRESHVVHDTGMEASRVFHDTGMRKSRGVHDTGIDKHLVSRMSSEMIKYHNVMSIIRSPQFPRWCTGIPCNM